MRSTSPACSEGRSRTPTSATGSTGSTPGSLHRLQVAIIPRNGPSRRVVEKLELREEGMAERYLEINGVWEDHVRYAITTEEWATRGEKLLAEWVS